MNRLLEGTVSVKIDIPNIYPIYIYILFDKFIFQLYVDHYFYKELVNN